MDVEKLDFTRQGVYTIQISAYVIRILVKLGYTR